MSPAVELRVHEFASERDAAVVWPLYDSVFGDRASYHSWRDAVWDRHTGRDGFRLAAAYEGAVLVGFAYGYTGRSGQWWTDNARTVLDREVAGAWLGGHFELVSLAVDTSRRRTGIGRALLRAVLQDLPHERLLLMTTADAADPARRLYASEGWQVVGPGIGDATVIMGWRRAWPSVTANVTANVTEDVTRNVTENVTAKPQGGCTLGPPRRPLMVHTGTRRSRQRPAVRTWCSCSTLPFQGRSRGSNPRVRSTLLAMTKSAVIGER